MAASLSGKKKQQPEPEMNVTPLVDVTLVLLIIMMVVAPSINEGERIELPAIELPDKKPKDDDPIEVTVAAKGRASRAPTTATRLTGPMREATDEKKAADPPRISSRSWSGRKRASRASAIFGGLMG